MRIIYLLIYLYIRYIYILYIYRCALTVAYEKSIACSTAKALEWDESFKNNTDESGRAILGIHEKST